MLAFSFLLQPCYGQQLLPLPLSSPASNSNARPFHLRAITRDNAGADFTAGFDPGDFKGEPSAEMEQDLLNYFFTGLVLPNSVFWVNLRPDASMDEVMDERLSKTDLGRVLFEADIQLKKDVSLLTSPASDTGRRYWDRMYAKAEALFGVVPAVVPTLCRPWIVPDQVIIRSSTHGAYVYKASLKIKLESERLAAGQPAGEGVMKELNEFSAELMRELIVPRLTRVINTSAKYGSLRQVVYSLALAQNVKTRLRADPVWGALIDSGKLDGLASKTPWSRQELFRQYGQSLNNGEYESREQARGSHGTVVRRFTSGGALLTGVGRGPQVTEIAGDGEVDIIKLLKLRPGQGRCPSALNGQARGTDGGEWFLDESLTRELFDRAWYEEDLRLHADSIITKSRLRNDDFSVRNGFRFTNSRLLNGVGERILQWAFARLSAPAGVLDLGPGAGVEPSHIFITAREMGKTVPIDTISLSAIAPSLLLSRDERGKLHSEILEQPYIRRQYVLPLTEAAGVIADKYRAIYDNYGAFYYTAMQHGLVTTLNLVLPLLDQEGVLYVCGLYSVADDPRFSRVPDEYIVIRVRKSDAILAFRKDSRLAAQASSWLSRVAVTSGNNIHVVPSLMWLVEQMDEEVFRPTVKDGGHAEEMARLLRQDPPSAERVREDIEKARAAGSIRYMPGYDRETFDSHTIFRGYNEENTRSMCLNGKRLYDSLLARSGGVFAVLDLGPGTGAETGQMHLLAGAAGKQAVIDTISLSPAPPSLMITGDGKKGTLQFVFLDKPYINTQTIGELMDVTPEPGRRYEMIYDQFGGGYYSMGAYGMVRTVNKVLPWLAPEGVLYISDIPIRKPRDESRVQEGFIVIRSNAQESILAFRAGSSHAAKIAGYIKTKRPWLDGMYHVDYREMLLYVNALSRDGGRQAVDIPPLGRVDQTGSAVARMFGLGGDLRNRPGIEIVEEKKFKGHDITRIRVSGIAARETELLRTELLAYPGMKVDTFDLMHDREGRLLAVFPIPSAGLEDWYTRHMDLAPKAKFLNLSYYYHDIPQLSEPGFREKWDRMFSRLKEQRSVIRGYKSLVERIPLRELGGEASGPYVYAEFNRSGGGYEIFRPIRFQSDGSLLSLLGRLPGPDSGKYQLITVGLPTVYSAGLHQEIDKEYYRALSLDDGLSGKRSLIVGPGTGIEAWMDGMRTGATVYCAGINPFEVANVRLTARLAGFRVEAIQADNIIDEQGNPRFSGIDGQPLLFDRIRWNMPAVSKPGGSPAELGRLQEKWDGDVNAVVLRRFARGVAMLLAPGGKALAWNRPWEALRGSAVIDLNEEWFKSGGSSDRDSPGSHLLDVASSEHRFQNRDVVKTYYISKPADGGTVASTMGSGAARTDESVRGILRAFGLAGDLAKRFEAIDEREFEGLRVRRVRARGEPDEGVRLLRKELMEIGGKEADTFDLMYDPDGRLAAVFPVPSDEMALWHATHKYASPRSYYLNLSYYYFDVPQVSDEGFRERWKEIITRLLPVRKVIRRYALATERIPLEELGEEAGGPYLYAEFYRRGGGHHVSRPELFFENERRLDGALSVLPGYDSGKHQVYTFVLPTVYSPVVNRRIDAGYYEALAGDTQLRQGQRSLVCGPGAGLEAWMDAKRTGSTVYCVGLNPLEVENVKITARLSGVSVEAIQGDNIIGAHDTPRFLDAAGDPLLFDRIRWNMPAVMTVSAAVANRGHDTGRLREAWDGDINGAAFERFARGVAMLLKPGGMALAWNSPREAVVNHRLIDINQELFETGGMSSVNPDAPHVLTVSSREQGVNNERVRTYLVRKLPFDGGSALADKGGIDLTRVAAFPDPAVPNEGIPAVPGFDFEKEWRQIEKLVNAGLIPAQERLALAFRPEYIKGKGDEPLSLLARVLTLQESACVPTDSALIAGLESAEAESSRNY